MGPGTSSTREKGRPVDAFRRRLDAPRHGAEFDLAVPGGQTTDGNTAGTPLLLAEETPAVQEAGWCEIDQDEAFTLQC